MTAYVASALRKNKSMLNSRSKAAFVDCVAYPLGMRHRGRTTVMSRESFAVCYTATAI